MTVYVLTEEGNTDYHSAVLGVFRTRAAAEAAKHSAIAEAIRRFGYTVYNVNDDDDTDWDRDYDVEAHELED